MGRILTHSGPQLLQGHIVNETYQVVRLLGRGGMGSVYAVRNMNTEGLFAIKVLSHEMSGDPDLHARFCMEARICSALHHPGIVQVIDLLMLSDGRPCIVMELLDGEDLERHLARVGRMPPAAALSITHDIGLALHAAHKADVFHCDLQAGNILLSRIDRGDAIVVQPKIIDFGMCRLQGPEPVVPKDPQVGCHGDQYALGRVLVQMLSGKLPCAAPAQEDEAEALRLRVPNLPAQVVSAVARALDPDPRRRFDSMLEFLAALSADPPAAGLTEDLSGSAITPTLSSPRPSAQPDQPAPSATVPHLRWRARKVLIIDDQADVREMVQTILEGEGYVCLGIEDGALLWEAIGEFEPDLILLDVTLPGKSGFQLCWELKCERDLLAKVVLLSGKTLPSDHQLGEAVRADGYVNKPFVPADLLTVLDQLLPTPRLPQQQRRA